jgi:hypothetical protein
LPLPSNVGDHPYIGYCSLISRGPVQSIRASAMLKNVLEAALFRIVFIYLLKMRVK